MGPGHCCQDADDVGGPTWFSDSISSMFSFRGSRSPRNSEIDQLNVAPTATLGTPMSFLENTRLLLIFTSKVVVISQCMDLSYNNQRVGPSKNESIELFDADGCLMRASCVFFRRMLNLAKQLKDRALEAQACYSLGNTYTLLGEYEEAIEYHMRHLQIAQELKDRCLNHSVTGFWGIHLGDK